MIILASKSPRRKELLSLITRDFTIEPAAGEEKADENLSPDLYVSALAENKAKEISAFHPDDTVIGADTIVAAKGEILGKPRYAEDAKRMLTLLSGTEHSVYTGVCVISKGEVYTFCEETTVRFFELSEEEIDDYIATGEPFDKAGAYGIQDYGALLVEGIEGDYYNVMGLPVGKLNRVLKEMNII